MDQVAELQERLATFKKINQELHNRLNHLKQPGGWVEKNLLKNTEDDRDWLRQDNKKLIEMLKGFAGDVTALLRICVSLEAHLDPLDRAILQSLGAKYAPKKEA